jgi:hypothetical protein
MRGRRLLPDVVVGALAVVVALAATKDVVDGVHRSRRVVLDERAYIRHVALVDSSVEVVGTPKVRFGRRDDFVCDRTREAHDLDARITLCASVLRAAPHRVVGLRRMPPRSSPADRF